MSITFHPANKSRWKDIEYLFGERGACGGCWCMTWRSPRAEFIKNSGSGNKRAFKKIVESNSKPGVLAYDKGVPIGWCSVAPRTEFSSLERARSLKPIDDQPVWSVSCLFVDKKYRRQKLAVELLKEAVKFAKKQGAKIVEGYPVIPYEKNMPSAFAWTGTLSAFLQAGFVEVKRPSKSRAIVRSG